MTTLIKTGLLWDGVGDKALPGKAILIDKDRIKAIGSLDDMVSIAHDKTLDWNEFTVLPGLIDCHTHLSMDPTLENYLDRMSDSIAQLRIRAISMMRKDLAGGVTTSRCLGDKAFLDVDCKNAVEDGVFEGPRLLVATRGIRAVHGHGFVGYPFDGEEEMVEAVNENIAKGADLIKFYITGTLKGDGDLPSFLTKKEIRSIIEKAHHAGIRTAAHCVGGIGLDWALELGLDSLEHGYHISDRQIESLSESDTVLVLTPSPILTKLRVMHLPKELIPGHIGEKEMISGRMAAFLSADLPFAVGTDGMHGELAQELLYIVELGASPIRVLRAATIQGAQVCGIEGETGSLEPGKFADLIAVRGNPLENIAALKHVVYVIKEGKVSLE